MTSGQTSYEKLLSAIRQELAPLNAKLDRLEATLDARYYTRENVDDKLKEVQTKYDALSSEVTRHEQGWQALTTKVAAWASIVYVLLNLAHYLH